MSTTTLTTVEQFEQLPQEDGVRYELKDGELVRMANAKYRHEKTKAMILRALVPYVLEKPVGEVHAEMSFALSSSRVYVPDVSFVSNEAAAKADLDHIFQGPPDVAIEVVSESESALDLREKIEDYLNAGSRAVWAFYPKVRVIDVYDESGVHEVRDDQILEAPEVLPGFQARAGQFFEY
jgi:Uma2 family endonuclease